MYEKSNTPFSYACYSVKEPIGELCTFRSRLKDQLHSHMYVRINVVQ